MNEPYFQVGEEVILVSKSVPELNGEYVVEHALPHGNWPNPYPSEFKRINVTEGAGYKLMGIEASETIPTGYFKQSALRKKHKPSSQSFSNLITNIEPIEETV